MGTILTGEDLAPFGVAGDVATAIIDNVEQRAFLVAPCLRTVTDPTVLAAAKSVLLPAALRWAANPTQSEGSESSGPFSVTLKPSGRVLLLNEEALLKRLCAPSGAPAAAASGLPQGAFPPARDYDALFSTPGRHGRWV